MADDKFNITIKLYDKVYQFNINRDEEEATGRKAFIHQDEIRRYSKPTEDNLNKVIFMVDTFP